MCFIDKLLDGAEVIWKPLGEITTITIGEFVRKDKQDPTAEYPVYNGGRTPTGYYAKFNNAGKKTIVSARGDAGFVNKSSTPYWAGNSCYSIGAKDDQLLHWMFVYYFLKSSEAKLAGMQQKGGIPAVSKKQMEGFQIPIPCPSNPKKSFGIQSEIVRILNAFAGLTAELTEELTARKKQCTYYRDQLLSFEDGEVEWKTLGEEATITIGEFVRKDKQDPNGKFPVYNGGRAPTGYLDRYNNSGDKIIVSARGANAGFVNRRSAPYWAGNSCYSIAVRDDEKLDWMFAYYYLKRSESKLIGIQQRGGIPAVSKKQMEDFLLPIPSMAEQTRVVAILDKFEELTNSVSRGLPREIELRQKQYEYYRDLLLSFPKPIEGGSVK